LGMNFGRASSGSRDLLTGAEAHRKSWCQYELVRLGR
jgi:hypothetical protein